jgi:hypothetical protein
VVGEDDRADGQVPRDVLRRRNGFEMHHPRLVSHDG